jgi:AsmA protein
MKRRLRTVLIIVGAVIVVLLILPFLIPVNQFRPAIEERASAALGRKVELGNLNLSLLSGSLAAGNLSIGDDPRFSASPFLTAKSLKVGVELMPLIFSRRLNVTGITIKSPQVTLLRNDAEQWNYSSLAGPAATAQPKQVVQAAKPSNSSRSPASLSIKQIELKDGQIIVGSTGSSKRSTYDHVNITASGFSFTSKFPFKVTADLPSGGKLKLNGVAGPLDQADISLTPLDASLNISSLNLASTDLLDPSLGLGGLLDLDANLNSKNGQAQTLGTAKLSKALLVAGGSSASVPLTVDFNTQYDLRRNAGALEPSTVKIGNAAAQLNGTYQTAGEATVVNIKVEGQNMPASDLESFVPALGVNVPKGATLQAGTVNANLNLTGPTNRMVTTGNVGLFNAKLAGFDLGSRMSSISSLAGIQTGKDLQITKLTSDVQMAPNGLEAHNFILVVPSLGRLTGAGTVDSRNNLDFKMAAILTQPQAAAGGPVSQGMGLISKVMGGGSGCKGGLAVPFRIEGTTSDPKFIPDVGGLASGMLKSQLGCAGNAASGATTGQNPANPVNTLENLLRQKIKH